MTKRWGWRLTLLPDDAAAAGRCRLRLRRCAAAAAEEWKKEGLTGSAKRFVVARAATQLAQVEGVEARMELRSFARPAASPSPLPLPFSLLLLSFTRVLLFVVGES